MIVGGSEAGLNAGRAGARRQIVRLACLTTLLCSVGASTTAAPATAADPIQVETISAGGGHTCAIKASGQAVCWGSNGTIGDGTYADRLVPTEVSDLDDATAISAGSSHTCAIKASGQAVCWGGNWLGQVGDGTMDDARLTPTPVSGLNDVTAISAGGNHTCAIKASGQAVCWGDNMLGQIGDSTIGTKSLTPTPVSGLNDVTAISAGGNHTCAIKASGQAVCWGWNWYGQVGDGTNEENQRFVPTEVSDLNDATAISAGGAHTCAIKASGQTVCWGANGWGQIGDGTEGNVRSTPTPVSGLNDVTVISAGVAHTCAIMASGQAVCWGDNVSGQVGDGTIGNERSTPTPVSGLTDATAISAGGGHTCAIKASGQAVCWGENVFGQIGDGTKDNVRLVPTYVVEGSGKPQPPIVPLTGPVPVNGESVVVAPKSGRVFVRLPGRRKQRRLKEGRAIPVGSIVDATRGKVTLTSIDKAGRTQTAVFFGGRFLVAQQEGSGLVILELRGGNLGSCKGGAGKSAAGASARKGRRLWGSGRGRFRTKGNYGAANVRGTVWLTEDRCGGTFFKVRKGSVTVRDFGARRTFALRAGKSYLAKKPG